MNDVKDHPALREKHLTKPFRLVEKEQTLWDVLDRREAMQRAKRFLILWRAKAVRMN